MYISFLVLFNFLYSIKYLYFVNLLVIIRILLYITLVNSSLDYSNLTIKSKAIISYILSSSIIG